MKTFSPIVLLLAVLSAITFLFSCEKIPGNTPSIPSNITVHVTGISLNNTSIVLNKGENASLIATIMPSNATNKAITWLSSNTIVATVSSSGVVTAQAAGSTTITVKTSDGNKTATCDVTVKSNYDGKKNGHYYVDLGLRSGTMWATCNVGASSPEDYGDYFAWGETKPKIDYDWRNYKFVTFGSNWVNMKILKYNTSSDYGTVDNNILLDLKDDAAYVNWGASWRIPFESEWSELRRQCAWEWTTWNGIYGSLFTGPNGNSIFLPATDINYDGAVNGGDYWSSSLYASDPSYAWFMSFGWNNVDGGRSSRCLGQSVRPVLRKL